MDAIELKHEIDKKIDSVAETIAFSYGEKFKDIVLSRVKSLMYYVYDNEEYQIDRLENMDLDAIALEFAKDLTAGLDVDESIKAQIERQLADVIYMGADFGVSDYLIRNTIANNEILSKELETNVEKLARVINYYRDDYKVKEIIDVINLYRKKNREFGDKIDDIKVKVLQSVLSIEVEKEDASYVWRLLDAFNPDIQYLLADDFYKDLIVEQQEEFYEILGCNGETLSELIEDARRFDLVIDGDKYYSVRVAYSELFNDLIDKHYQDTSNIEEIIEDLQKKGYRCDKESICGFLAESSRLS